MRCATAQCGTMCWPSRRCSPVARPSRRAGALGVITEITLRLCGLPEAISGGICPFPSVEAACEATIATIQSGIPAARIELLDALQVKAVNLYSKFCLPERPMLCVEFHGT